VQNPKFKPQSHQKAKKKNIEEVLGTEDFLGTKNACSGGWAGDRAGLSFSILDHSVAIETKRWGAWCW
jgi:hypothetical protein